MKEKILIIEKDEHTLQKMKAILGSHYRVNIFQSSTEAIEHLNSEASAYSVIICSMDMPEINGYELTLTLKKDTDIRNIPIILVGKPNIFNNTEIPKGLRLGEFEKVHLPLDDKELMHCLTLCIRKKNLLDKLETSDVTDNSTLLFTFDYFKEMLDIEVQRAIQMNYPLCCFTIQANTPEIMENLLAIIKSTCRHYDIATAHNNNLLILFTNISEKDTNHILIRLNSLIYGIKISFINFKPSLTDPESFKQGILNN